ncbi:MAG: LytR C-terminal domain-containing protein [Candidatus Levybacteria bacterium]|nr:LytR C-terminal domain-containing protein [Candidatus Levybacteria bacterium]
MIKRKNKKTKNQNNLRIGVIFCLFVCFLITVSLIFKLILLLQSSKFDGKHNFSVVIYEQDSKSKKAQIISFAPDVAKISVLKILAKKPSDLAKILEVPIDGTIKIPGKGDEEVESMLGSALLGFKDTQTNLTIIDISRLWLFAKSVSNQSISANEISLDQVLTDEAIDKISSQIFSDNSFSAEKISIQIVNGTGFSGLGNRLARLISNMGGNVVSVLTSDKNIESSEILYVDEETYTLERLTKILGFKKTKMNGAQISDIIIKIGKDSLPPLNF